MMCFRKLVKKGTVCVICDSEGMFSAVEQYLPNNISIFQIGDSPKNPWKKGGSIPPDEHWNEEFESHSFKEYRIIHDDEYSDLETAAIAFLAIKKFHPLAQILDCRILGGQTSKHLRTIIKHFHSHSAPVGKDREAVAFKEIAATWEATVALPESFTSPKRPPSGSVEYIRHLKYLKLEHDKEFYNFKLEWGKRDDLKKLVLQNLKAAVGNHLQGLVPLATLIQNVTDKWQEEHKVMRSGLTDTLVEILDEMSSPCLPLIQEQHHRSATNDMANYLQFRLNVELYELVFKNGIEAPLIPLGAFTGCCNYNGLTWPAEDPNDIMRYLVLRSLGLCQIENLKTNPHDYIRYTMDKSAKHINALIEIWNTLLDNQFRRRRIQFQLDNDYEASLNVTCCEKHFTNLPELRKHIIEPHFLI